MSETESDHFYLPRKDQSALLVLLRQLPALVEELAITETRQAVVRKVGMGSPRRPKKRDSTLPYHAGAFEASMALHNELGTWIRLVCEQRAVEQPTAIDILTRAHWLDKHMISLAMTEGAEVASSQIHACVSECERMIDLPPEDEIFIDHARIEQANRFVGPAAQIAKLASKLGEHGKGLTERRIKTLTSAEVLRPCGLDGDTRFYRMGDALRAHYQHARRSKPARPA